MIRRALPRASGMTALLAAAACAAACASSSGSGTLRPAAAPAPSPEQQRARTADFARAEDEVLGWVAAADPRLAARTGSRPGDEVLKRIGTEAVLAEDTAAQIRGGALDLFAFQARARALDQAAKQLASFREPLPEEGPVGSGLARPRLERELLERLVDEERARAGDEAKLGDAAGDLVRGIVETWTPPASPQEWPQRDAWVSKHLLDIRESLRDAGPRTGPPDLDVSLYPLERLLAPAQFPKGAAAIAQLRMQLDGDMRAVPKLDAPDRIARATKLHLGMALDAAALRPRLEHVEARLREAALSALAASGDGRRAVEARARELLLVERPCPAVPDSRVRSMAPPPERAAICGALRVLTEEASAATALIALHDDVLLAFSAVVVTPPPRTGLLSHPEDDDVDALERMARERPVVPLGVALAAELLYGRGDGASERLQAWRALGEAPLDVVARELRVTPVSGSEPQAAR